MPTVEERYAAATAYVRRAVATVEARGFAYTIDPVSGLVEWYAAKNKTEQPRNDLTRIEMRWLRATTDPQRAEIARDAELLADRVEESLPGAPQDRARTNLFRGEVQHSTAATSYAEELAAQSGATWSWVERKASGALDEVATIGRWLLIGGGLVGAWKLFGVFREQRSVNTTERELNANLSRVAARSAR